jgi:hypothetical protein
MIVLALASCLALPLAGCDRHKFADPDSGQMATAAPSAGPLPVPTVRAPTAAAASTPSAARDAETVTNAWARAVEARDWALARAYWGEHGAASGQSLQAFAAKWNKLAHPQVTLGPAEEDGAAGSLFYDQPVVIVDGTLDAAAKGKTRRLSGHVVWRRVNDVDGASPEQLRWHIESSTLAP